MDKKKKKKGAQGDREKKAKQCTLITAALHFSAFYLSRGIDFMASITFNGVELWKEPWSDTEAAVRRNPKGFTLTFLFFSLLSLFSSIILFFPAHGGKMLILSEEYLEFCLPQWLCFATGVGYCPYIQMVSIVHLIYMAGVTLCLFVYVCAYLNA